MKTLFKYSGNKSKLFNKYRLPPDDFQVIEPYLGSGGYSMNVDNKCIGFEIDDRICEMWWWLQRTSEKELLDLNIKFQDFKKTAEKPDVRDMNLEVGPEIYVKVNATSVVVGQMSAWKIYPQNVLPIDKTIECLKRIKNIEVRNESAEKCLEFISDKTILFLDPPYIIIPRVIIKWKIVLIPKLPIK